MKLIAPIIVLNLMTQHPLPLFTEPDWSSFYSSPPPIPEDSPEEMAKMIEDAVSMETLRFLQSNASLADRVWVAETVLNMTDVSGPDVTAGGLLDDWNHTM